MAIEDQLKTLNRTLSGCFEEACPISRGQPDRPKKLLTDQSNVLSAKSEKLVDRFIRDTHISKWPLHYRQHAYQKGKSTETALHELMAKIEKAMFEKEYALGAFMDIEGALNYASFAAICDAVRQHGIEPLLISWILHMLEWRKIHISVGQKSIEAGCLRGCPQGGVLSTVTALGNGYPAVAPGGQKVFAQAFAGDLA